MSDDSRAGNFDESHQGVTALSITGGDVNQIGPSQAQIQEANDSGIKTDGVTRVNTTGSKDLFKFKSDGGQGDENTPQHTDKNGTVPLFVNSATALNNTVVTISNGPTTDVVYTSKNSSPRIGVSDRGTEKQVHETEELPVQKINTTEVKNNSDENNSSNEGGRSTADSSHVQKRAAIMKQVSKFVSLTEEEGLVEERKTNTAQVERQGDAE